MKINIITQMRRIGRTLILNNGLKTLLGIFQILKRGTLNSLKENVKEFHS